MSFQEVAQRGLVPGDEVEMHVVDNNLPQRADADKITNIFFLSIFWDTSSNMP